MEKASNFCYMCLYIYVCMYVCIFGPLRIPCEIDYELKLEASSSTDAAHKKMQTRLRELFPILSL